MKIAVIGYSGNIDENPVKPLTTLCEALGLEIVKRGHTLVTGGRDGVMEAVSKGAAKFGGTIVGILPANDTGNNFLTIRMNTGMDYSMRSILMMYNVDVVISIGGKAGTGLEIFAAYGHFKPIFLLRGTGGWTDRIANTLLDGKYLDERRQVEIKSVWSVEEALEEIELLEASK